VRLQIVRRRRGWAKNPKPRVCDSVSGAPCETAVWDDAGRWWVQVNDMEAVGGHCVCASQREARGRDLGQKPENERSLLSFGCAM
jgi:hypothetical protein